MKICDNCGVSQSDERTVCVDCGAVLGKPVSGETEEQIKAAQSDRLSDMASRTDDFHVGKINIICIAILAATLAGDIVLMFMNADSGAATVYLQLAFCSAVGIIDAAFPKLGWKLYTLRFIFIADTGTLNPSGSYYVFYHIFLVVITIACVFATLFTLIY